MTNDAHENPKWQTGSHFSHRNHKDGSHQTSCSPLGIWEAEAELSNEWRCRGFEMRRGCHLPCKKTKQNAVVFHSDQVIHTQIWIVSLWLLVLDTADPGPNSPKLLQMISNFRLLVELKQMSTPHYPWTCILVRYSMSVSWLCLLGINHVRTFKASKRQNGNMLITDCPIPNWASEQSLHSHIQRGSYGMWRCWGWWKHRGPLGPWSRTKVTICAASVSPEFGQMGAWAVSSGHTVVWRAPGQPYCI